MVTALVLLFTLRAAEADQRVRTDLLADLLAFDRAPTATRRADEAALVERGRLLGIRLQAPHVLVVCRTGPVRPRGLLLAARRPGRARAGRGARRRRGRAGAGQRPGRGGPRAGPRRAPTGTGRSRWARSGR